MSEGLALSSTSKVSCASKTCISPGSFLSSSMFSCSVSRFVPGFFLKREVRPPEVVYTKPSSRGRIHTFMHPAVS